MVSTLNIRVLNESDYEQTLIRWWKDWGWEPPCRDFLPDNGTGGLLVSDGDEPVCAGFVYVTNSRVAWIDWIVSSKTYRKKPNRKQALSLLIDSLSGLAKGSGSKYGYALIKNQSLIETYQSLGYVKADSYTGEMIKTL